VDIESAARVVGRDEPRCRQRGDVETETKKMLKPDDAVCAGKKMMYREKDMQMPFLVYVSGEI
jgi:hypothetical protein